MAAPSLALGGQLHAGFWANVTYTATSVIQVWMQCLVGVPCGCGRTALLVWMQRLVGVVFLHTSRIKLYQFVLSPPAVSNLMVVEGALEPHSLCLQVINHVQRFRFGKDDKHLRKANSY